jgi:hypothetical protein
MKGYRVNSLKLCGFFCSLNFHFKSQGMEKYVTTNQGVGSSNLSGRATHTRGFQLSGLKAFFCSVRYLSIPAVI